MITSVHLGAFKAFSSLELHLGNLTLLTGVNGTGKSSVIQALLALRQSYLQKQLFEENRLVFNGDLIRLGTVSDAFHDDPSTDRDTLSLALTWSDGQRSKWSFPISSGRTSLIGSHEGASDERSRSLFTSDFHYISAERIGPRVAYPTNDDAVWNQRQLGIQGEYAAHFLSLFGATHEVQLAGVVRGGAASTRLRDQVEAWLDVVSPGTRLHTTPHAGMDVVQLAFSFARASSVTNQYRPTNVGFGLTYILPVLVALLSASTRGIVIIENPEAHLHPKGQAVLGDLIARVANAGVQVIVETHSDHLLNGVRVAAASGHIRPADVRIHFFTRTREGQHGVVSPTLDAQGRLSDWPEDFFDQWDKSLEDLIRLKGRKP